MTRPRSAITEKILAESNSILETDAPMTLRHLFYILVSRGFIENTEKDYKNLSRITCSARREGRMEISAIVDNSRYETKITTWTDMEEYLDQSVDDYTKDYWSRAGQTVEVWIEKDAIAGVLESITDEYHIRLRVTRGFPSVGFLNTAIEQLDQSSPLAIYYVGDHDPSGNDIERCCREGIADLTADGFDWTDGDLTWKRLAINPEDFKTFGIAPLPAKSSDPRYKGFVAEHGTEAAEVDALPPDELRRRVREAIKSNLDNELWESVRAEQEDELVKYKELVETFRNGQ